MVAYLKASPRLLVPVLTPTGLSCTISNNRNSGQWLKCNFRSLVREQIVRACTWGVEGYTHNFTTQSKDLCAYSWILRPVPWWKIHRCGWGKGGFHGSGTSILKKEKNSQLLHAARGVFSYMIKCEYWLSLLSIDRSVASMDNLNHRRISADL